MQKTMVGRPLGRLPRRVDPVAPSFAHVCGVAPLRLPPASADWAKAVKTWPMLANDEYGDCAWAALLHAVQLWTANAGTEIVPDTACALDDYSGQTGFQPGPPVVNDNGAVLLDALQYWMHTGIAIATNGTLDRLDSYAVIEPADINGLKRAIADFGCCLLGVDLPQSAEDQTEAGMPWALLNPPDTPIGGHAILAVAYDADGFDVITWGQVQRVTWDWWATYGSEAYALLRREWIERSGVSPSGLSMAQLDALILRMRGTLGLGATA